MRTNVPVVLALLLVNDLLLIALLETSIAPWGVVLIAALALTIPIVVVAGRVGDSSKPPSRADLDEKVRGTRADLTRLEKRVADVERAGEENTGDREN